MDDQGLVSALLGLLASGRVDNSFILPVLRELGKDSEKTSTTQVLEALSSRGGGAVDSLRAHLKSRRRLEALRLYNRNKSGSAETGEASALLDGFPTGVPCDWSTSATASTRLKWALGLQCEPDGPDAGHRLAVASRAVGFLIDPLALIEALESEAATEESRPALKRAKEAIQSANDEKIAHARRFLLEGEAAFPFDIDEDAAAHLLREAAAAAPEAKRRALDVACSWPTSGMAPLIRELADDAVSQERAGLILAMRLGENIPADWPELAAWLARAEEADADAQKNASVLALEYPGDLLALWLRGRPAMPQELVASLPTARRPAPAEPAAPVAGKPPEKKAVAQPLPPVPAAAPAPAPAPPEASFWDEHALPFLAENWGLITGIAMVVAGSSVLAYYTWDKHWIVRYTILPALFAGFTAVLARVGIWLERQDAKLKGTADMLRGAAVALLPANFMAVALLARDPQVTHKEIVLPVVSALYLAGFGRALRRWCAHVHPKLEALLGNSLLIINALVLLGPFAQVFDPTGENEWFLLGAGFHAGFILVCLTILRFARTDIMESAAEEARVPWFFGVSLASTFLQVFLWVYGFMGHLPRIETYAMMVVASGGLVLYAERFARALRKDAQGYGGPSFIGFALILLGVFMGASQPQVRLAALALAGAIWLAQAVDRKDLIHGWIAFTLLVLGAGSIGTWESFPGPWIPALALAIAAAVGAATPLVRRLWQELESVAAQMQAAVLNVATVLAVLVQWHYNSEPLMTVAFLLVAAAMFGWRAHRDQKLLYVHTVMAILAVSLPYLGFADMTGRTLHGNNVVFGLALLCFLWIAAASWGGTPLLLNARSTVLLVYGAIALTAMLLRVAFEQGRPENLLPGQAAMSLAGPSLITIALVLASYFSRSLLPGAMAALIIFVLAPQLREESERYLPFIDWGSGIMSGLWAAALSAACFRLRRAAFLQNLDEGDRFSASAPFPLQRRDHTLFTTPVIVSAFFLATKVDTWNLLRNILGSGVHLKTSFALMLAGLAWTLMAVYLRARQDSRPFAHFGWLSFAAGLAFLYYDQAQAPVWHRALLLCGGALNALFLFYRYWLAPRRAWAEDLLAAPLRRVLWAGAIAVSALVIVALSSGDDAVQLAPLACYAAVELVWFGLTDGQAVFGALLFVQAWVWLLARFVPGAAALMDRATFTAAATPSLLYLLGIQALHLALEPLPSLHKRLKPLLEPVLVLASIAALGLGFAGLVDGISLRLLTQPQAWLLAAVVLATARAQVCGPLFLQGLFLVYLAALYPALRVLTSDQARLDFLLSPWRLGGLSLLMAAWAQLADEARSRWPALLEGGFASAAFRLPVAPCVRYPALVVATYAVASQLLDPSLRATPLQLTAPYLAAATFALAGLSIPGLAVFATACLYLGIGNVHVVRFYAGDFLRQRGLMENHLLCIGATATLLEFSLLRLLFKRDKAQVVLNRVCLAAAGFVLTVLAGTYFIRPDLEAMSDTRFVLSGLMAYIAGRYFQRAARRPDPGERRYIDLWEGLYHFGVTTAIWCAAMLVPWFRHPNAAFPALGLPVVYFYLRAEIAPRGDAAAVARYRNTAAALSFFMLVLYAFRGAFQLVLFPGAPIGVDHYHFNAPFVILLSLLMLRLRGLGGTDWLALYGGLGMMTGSYFAITRLPGLSPFDYPMPSTWAAVGLGHFWLLFCSRPSPLKTFLRRIAGIDDALWQSLQSTWGLLLLVATQSNLLWGLSDYASNTYMVAPLLLGGASLLVHQGVIRDSKTFFVFAGLEAMAALHADFFVDSYLRKDGVVWALLAIWAAALVAAQARPQRLSRKTCAAVSLPLGAAVLIQVFYHHPDSTVGLWTFGAGALLAAMTPCEPEAPSLAGLLLCAPTWLVYFSQNHKAFPWPTLATSGAIFLTGQFSRWVEERYPASAPWRSSAPCLLDQTLFLLGRQGCAVNSFLLSASFALTAFVQAAHYDKAFAGTDLALILGLYAAQAYAWYHEGMRRKSMPPYFMLQFCVLGFCAVVRRQLMLTLHFWNYEYDVWASLVVSYSLAGAKQMLPFAPRETRIPLLGTLLTMPVAAMIWVLIHHLGTNTVLLVIGLYSLMFSYMGKDDQESPYHLIAVGGFVSFILIVFWTKLELRVVQAYVIPVGLGVLVLLQLFRNKIAPAMRNEIRAVTLLSMLASAGYYALMDDRYPMAFHMTMLLLGVLAMSIGSFLRVRLYVLLGFAGIMTDLGSIIYKVMIHMERTSRMTLIGSQVLFLGAALIFGAVAYKTHQEEFNEKLEYWRQKLTSWE